MAGRAQTRFNREAFIALLEMSNFPSGADFAKAAGISPGTLVDITKVDPETGLPRRVPSMAVIKKLASALKVPLPALLRDPELAR